MQLTIRQAIAADAEGMFETHSRAVREIVAKDYTPEQINSWMPIDRSAQTYRDWMATEGNFYFICEQDGKIIGLSGIRENNVTLLYIHPEFTGRKLAGELFAYTEKEMRQRGHSKMILTSTLTARSFYQKMGMQSLREQDYTLPDGVNVRVIAMEKEL